jgi:hypothetical protein
VARGPVENPAAFLFYKKFLFHTILTLEAKGLQKKENYQKTK